MTCLLFEDGSWKQEFGEKDWIIALTTKLTEMQATFKQQVALFAIQATNNRENNPAPNSDAGSRCSKKAPYTVAAWRLVKREDKVTVNDQDYFWCTGDHYSGGEKYDGMYAGHKSADHDMWHKTIDDCRVIHTSGKSSNDKPAPATSAIAQKLTRNYCQ
jgi:hypothetical protein